MSVRRTSNMRIRRWQMTPLLLLLLLTSLTGSALCQEDDEGAVDEDASEDSELKTATLSEDDAASYSELPTSSAVTVDPSLLPETTAIISDDVEGSSEDSSAGSTGDEDGSEGTEGDFLSPIIIMIPVVLVVLIIAMVVAGIVISRRCNRNASDADHRKEDPYLDGNSTEKVPMPMFEEDVPSVLELEMEDLDQWINKDGATAAASEHV